MRRTRLLCAIGVSVWSTVVTGNQAPAAAELSVELRTHVKDERFGIVTAIRGLPLGVRDGLQTLFGSYSPRYRRSRRGSFRPPMLSPIQSCHYVGWSWRVSTDHCIVYYERGGGAHTWHVALFHWTPESTRFEWGGIAPRGLASLDDVRNAILSEAIKGPAKVW